MTNQMLTLQEAAFISRKSAQTIRRLIKSNKIKYRKRKTPQGFNYYIEKESLLDFFDLTPRVLPEEPIEEQNFLDEKQTENEVAQEDKSNSSVFNAKIAPVNKLNEQSIISRRATNNEESALITDTMRNTISLQTKQLQKFADTINQLITQHHREKGQLYSIIQNYEAKVKMMENQLRMLSAPKKKWYEFWK